MLIFEDTKHWRHGTARFKEEREEDLSSLENSRLKFESSYWNEEVAHDEA